MIRALLDAIDRLDMFPQRYDIARTGSPRGRNVRSMPVKPYLVRYRIDEGRSYVFILHVRHGAQRGA